MLPQVFYGAPCFDAESFVWRGAAPVSGCAASAMHRSPQAALGLFVDAYEAPSNVANAGFGLFLGEHHLSKGDPIAFYCGKWHERQLDHDCHYRGRNPNVMMLDNVLVIPQARHDGLARYANENPCDCPATAEFIRWHTMGDILPHYQWPAGVKPTAGMDAICLHAATDLGPHEEIRKLRPAPCLSSIPASSFRPPGAFPLVPFAVAYYGKQYAERRSWTAGGPSGLRKKDLQSHQRPGRTAEALQILIPNHAFKFR